MIFYIGVLFIVLAGVNPGLGGFCGKLFFEQDSISVGSSVILTYEAHNYYASLKWYKTSQSESIVLYDSSKPTDTRKYVQTSRGTLNTLTIRNVEQADAGSYTVYCGTWNNENAVLKVIASSPNRITCGTLSFNQTSVTVGGTARLVYKPIDIRASRKWYKVKEQRTYVIYDNTSRPNTTKYTEKQQEDQFVLTITGVELKDTGSYILSCVSGWSSRAMLQVVTSPKNVPTAPSAPQFEDIEDIHKCKNCLPARLNVEMDVMCFVEGGSEPIELEMFKMGQRLSNTQREYKNSLKRTILKYTFTPSAEDFDTVFKCTVKNPAMAIESGSSSPLYIRVDPETVDIKVLPAKENETTEVQCTTTKGRPPIKSQICFKSGQENVKITSEDVTGHTYSVTTTLSRSFTRYDNKDDIFCCSNILTTKCSNPTRVDVKFPPRNVNVTELNKINEENGDTTLTLKCSVDESNPKSMVDWKGVKNLPKKVFDKNYEFHNKTGGWNFTTVLMFNLTKNDNFRNIRCQVTNQEFPDLLIQHSYRPNITYAPVITLSEQRNKTVYIGEDVFLTCRVDSNPPPVKVSWHNKTDILEETYGANASDLYLANITLEHSQTYTCTATNNIGDTRRRDITLIVKDASEKTYKQPSSDSNASSVAGPVIGTAVVIIVAVVAIVIFLTVRKRKQNTALKRKESNEIKTEERKQSVHPAGNEPVYNNMAASNNENEVEDLPDYAAVVPRADRKRETEQINPSSDMPEKGDNLVYAELDLTNPSKNAVRRPLTEPTEYVSIDFTKTGTVQIDDEIHVVSD